MSRQLLTLASGKLMNPFRAYIALANKYLNTPILNLYSANSPKYQRQFIDELKPNKSTTILTFTYPIIIIQSAYCFLALFLFCAQENPGGHDTHYCLSKKKRTINSWFGFIQKIWSDNDHKTGISYVTIQWFSLHDQILYLH